MEIYKDNLIPTLTWEEVVTPPQNTLVNQRIIGGSITGTSFISNTDNARVEIFPENNQEVGLQVLNASGENVFGAYIAGNSAGDVSIGNYAGNQGILWDNSTGKLNVKGEIVVTGDITSANYSAVVPYAGYKLEYSTGYLYGNNVIIRGGTIGGQTVDNVGIVATTVADSVPDSLASGGTGITLAGDGTISSYVTLTWTAITSDTFDYYVIRYKKHSYTYYEYTTSKTNNINIDGLTPNTSYDFGISSVNKFGSQSAFSTDITVTTAADTTPPVTVTSNSATAGIQCVFLEWTHNTDSDLASYNIYRNTTNDSATSSLLANCRTNYFVDMGLTGGQPYYYWIKAVDTSGNVSTSYSTVQTATPRNVNSADTNVSNQGWTQTCVFSSTDTDTVTWGAGVFTTASGTSYNILAGNTGNMSARTYIYLDIAVSTTAYQITTTATSAVGDGKVLIGVAENNTGEAVFQIFGGIGGANWKGGDIVAGSVTTNEIASNTIVAGNIAAGTITSNEIATNTIVSDNVLNISGSKILIDGATTFLNTWFSYKGDYEAGTTYKKYDQVYYSLGYWNYINSTPSAGNTPTEGIYWTSADSQITTIDGGEITANSITTTQLNFTPVQSTDVIASINASEEGITIDADNITISGSTTFASGYDPSIKRRVFTAEPTSPYDIGDLWASGVFLKKCKTARASGAYVASEWEYATGYTDDTVANTKIQTFAQVAIPTSITAGDFWIDTKNGNKLYRAVIAGADEIKAGEWVEVPDQNKLGGTGSSAVGGSYSSTSSGARVLIFPDSNTGIQIIDDDASDVFKCIIGGLDVGDVILGNYSAGQGIKYDKSANTTTFAGSLSAPTGTLGALTIATGGNIKLGQTAYNTGTGFWLGDDMGTTKFSLGNPAGDYITWDGTEIDTTGLNINTRFVAGETIATGDIVCIKPSYTDYTASQTAYVDGNSGYRYLNFYSADYINIGSGGLRLGFIEFNSSIINLIPAGEFILRAELILTSREAISSCNLGIKEVLSATWDETTITYNTAPASSSANIGTQVKRIGAGYAGLESVLDITQLVRQWKEGALTNRGIEVGVDKDAKFFSNRAATPSFRPKLRIYSSYSSDGKVYKANSGDYLTSRSIVGVALEGKNVDENIKVQVGGVVKDITTSNPGGKIYLNTVSGGVAESSSGLSNIIQLGSILDNNKILWGQENRGRLIESIDTDILLTTGSRILYVPDDCTEVLIYMTDTAASPTKYLKARIKKGDSFDSYNLYNLVQISWGASNKTIGVSTFGSSSVVIDNIKFYT